MMTARNARALVALALAGFSVFTCAPRRDELPVHTKSLLLTSRPDVNQWPVAEPGETVPLPRPYKEYPPFVPHRVIDMAPGDCVDCHMAGYRAGEGHVATKIPKSHYLNKFTGEKTDEQPISIRSNCLQCHVVQTAGTPPYETDRRN